MEQFITELSSTTISDLSWECPLIKLSIWEVCYSGSWIRYYCLVLRFPSLLIRNWARVQLGPPAIYLWNLSPSLYQCTIATHRQTYSLFATWDKFVRDYSRRSTSRTATPVFQLTFVHRKWRPWSSSPTTSKMAIITNIGTPKKRLTRS